MTAEGLQKLKEELQRLEAVERPRVIAAIAEARDKGDLSENAEYDAALDEQRDIEARIGEIEAILKNSEVMGDHPDDGTINIGSHVTIREVGTDFDMDIEIVGASEANSLTRRISNESPVGKELMHKQQGEIVSVETADGLIKYEILKVEPPKA